MGRQGGSPEWVAGVGRRGGSPGWVAGVGRQGGSPGWVAGVGRRRRRGCPSAGWVAGLTFESVLEEKQTTQYVFGCVWQPWLQSVVFCYTSAVLKAFCLKRKTICTSVHYESLGALGDGVCFDF